MSCLEPNSKNCSAGLEEAVSKIKTTPLYACHENRQACLVPFAGWLLPLRFNSEQEEHLAVREEAGIFDVSHMGEFLVNGHQAFNFLQRVLSNDLKKISPGLAQYTLLLNEHAGIIDDLIVYQLAQNQFMLCVNAINIEKDWQWLNLQAQDFSELELKNESGGFAQIALQGPSAKHIWQQIAGVDNWPKPHKHFWLEQKIDQKDMTALIAHTGYTGEPGIEIFLAPTLAPIMWEKLLTSGQKQGLKPCGLAARDSLRVEAGLLLYGVDMDEMTTPKEVGLMFAVEINKPDFIGKSALSRHTPLKKLLGFRLLKKGFVRAHQPIYDHKQKEIGLVTSSAWPKSSPYAFGFCLLDLTAALTNKEIFIKNRENFLPAVLQKPKFI